MATTLTAEAIPSAIYLTCDTDAAGAATIVVQRSMQSRVQDVRAWPGIAAATPWVHYDIDVLFGTPITYQAFIYDDAGVLLETSTEVGPITLSDPHMIVRDSIDYNQTMRARIVENFGTSTTVRQELLRPLGRTAPLAITDVRSGRSGSVALLTLNDAERSALTALLATGNVLQLTGPADIEASWPLYFTATTVTSESVRWQQGAWLWTVDWIEVDAPPVTEPVPATTWQDLLDAGTTWNDILQTSWFDVMYPKPGAA